ncbi:thioredoxin [Actinokineospora auranticolor]|uniref:Thioredoxin n=1 Tax=Actinokineospora auranticolor TaxID=155976 RepID=A0A2S6GI15_9PSEU|nr:thioredoxin [Actinokineospora auranticolor]PPK64855.1 thioredoxin 1 [Actinokineospora auranticolor]
MAELTVVTDETFAREVLASDIPVLVDFWAQWCPPCHMITPVLAQLADELAGRLRIVKINNDQNPVTGRDYQVMSLPTLLVFHNGLPVRSFVGARPKAKLLGELTGVLDDLALPA